MQGGAGLGKIERKGCLAGWGQERSVWGRERDEWGSCACFSRGWRRVWGVGWRLAAGKG